MTRYIWPEGTATQDKTDISYVNVFYPPGNGANFILHIMRKLLKFKRFTDSDNAGADIREKNEYTSTIMLPILNRWHASDIGADIEFSDWSSSRNIYIRSEYTDYMNFGARLFALKRTSNRDNIENYEILSHHYHELETYMAELNRLYPMSVFVLDYKKFFEEQDDKHISDFFDYIHAFNFNTRDIVIADIKNYHNKNVQFIEDYLSDNPDIVSEFLNNNNK